VPFGRLDDGGEQAHTPSVGSAAPRRWATCWRRERPGAAGPARSARRARVGPAHEAGGPVSRSPRRQRVSAAATRASWSAGGLSGEHDVPDHDRSRRHGRVCWPAAPGRCSATGTGRWRAPTAGRCRPPRSRVGLGRRDSDPTRGAERPRTPRPRRPRPPAAHHDREPRPTASRRTVRRGTDQLRSSPDRPSAAVVGGRAWSFIGGRRRLVVGVLGRRTPGVKHDRRARPGLRRLGLGWCG